MNAVVKMLQERRAELHQRFSVCHIGVFGSFGRGEGQTDSDVDILVEFEKPTFDHYMDLKFFLEDVLKRKVDLVMSDTLKPRIRSVVEREVQYA